MTLLLIFSLELLATSAGQGQVITGKIVGSVKDESGAALHDAVVTVTSPAFLTGPSATTTNERGAFRFPFLPPGEYTLEVSSSGFQTYREEGIRVAVGATLEMNVTLTVARIAERVTVIAEGLMDKVGVSVNYGSEYIQNIPRQRSDVLDFIKIAPGISATRPSSVHSPYVSTFGSGVNENLYLIDGADRTDVVGGAAAPFLDTDTIEEIEILSLGASAEYGNIQGSVFNIVTKQGGNDWRFDASYYHQNQSLTSQPLALFCNCPGEHTAFSNNEYHDFGTHVGGPLMSDRLWVYGGYQYRRSKSNPPGTDPRFPNQGFEYRLTEKLNWQITPKLKLMQTFLAGSLKSPSPSSISFPFETEVTFTGHDTGFNFARLSYIFSESTLFDFQISGHFVTGKLEPNSGNRALPFHFDLFTGIASGGSYAFGHSEGTRIPVSGKLTHYSDDFLGGEHQFKFGVQFIHGSHRMTYGYPGGAWYYDYGAAPSFAVFKDPDSDGGQFRNLGAFAEDVFRIGQRLTLNLGVRFDRSKAISQDVPAVDEAGNPTGETAQGLGTLFSWKVLSPRLGFGFKLTSDGRTVLRANWGKFYQGVLTGEIDNFHPGLKPTTIAYFQPSTGRYSNIVAVFDPLENQDIDTEMRPPNTDQFSIGLERELWPDAAIGVTFVRKSGRDFTGWVDTGGVYRADTAYLRDGRTLEVFPLLNSTSERLFLLTNPEGWSLEYKGLLVTFDKRWSSRWQALLSYTLSEAVGLQASSGPWAGGPQFSLGSFRNFGADPNDLTNAEGNLADDRTHMFRVQGVAEIPRIGVLVAASFQYLIGKPWAGTSIVSLPQGDRHIFVEPRGTRRLPSQNLLDLRLSKTFRFNERGKLELLVDILNALNETAFEDVITTNLFSFNFGRGRRYVVPRRAMLGIKWVF